MHALTKIRITNRKRGKREAKFLRKARAVGRRGQVRIASIGEDKAEGTLEILFSAGCRCASRTDVTLIAELSGAENEGDLPAEL